jgi:hypothetical protein
MRPITKLERSTLILLLPMLMSVEKMGEILGISDGGVRPGATVRVFADRARTEPTVSQRVLATLEQHFGYGPLEICTIEILTAELRTARRDAYVWGIARVLWAAARQRGQAWRRLEVDAREELVLAALCSARDVSDHERMAAK